MTLDTVLNQARQALRLGQLSQAAGFITEARELASSACETALVVDTFGAILAQKNDLKNALSHHLTAARIVRDELNNWDGLVDTASPPNVEQDSANPLQEARFLANAGTLAQLADSPNIALAAFKRALSLFEQCQRASTPLPKTHGLEAELRYNYGVLLMNTNKVLDAIPQLKKAVELDEQRNAPPEVLHSDLLRLAAALRRSQQEQELKAALTAAERARGLVKGLNPVLQASTDLEIGAIQFAMGDILDAMSVTRKAIDLLESVPDYSMGETGSLQLGRAYVDMAIYARRLKRKNAALVSLNRAQEMANNAQSPVLAAMIARERGLLSSLS